MKSEQIGPLVLLADNQAAICRPRIHNFMAGQSSWISSTTLFEKKCIIELWCTKVLHNRKNDSRHAHKGLSQDKFRKLRHIAGVTGFPGNSACK